MLLIVCLSLGQRSGLLASRHTLHLQAWEIHPAHWSGPTRDWSFIDVVTYLPGCDQEVNMAAGGNLCSTNRVTLATATTRLARPGCLDGVVRETGM